MCGLIGGSAVLPIFDDHAAVLRRVIHRGPDSHGSQTLGGYFLGHTRLAIQDYDARSDQPYRSGPVTLTYNGELWYPDRVRALLDERTGPRQWATTGDTEPLAALLAHLGWQALDRLSGVFALAWHDERTGTWLARDRYGEIPLYAARSSDGLWMWASELKAFPRGLPAQPVEPGTAVHLDEGRVYRWATWEPGQPATPERVRDLLEEGVRSRLLSDRPVCFMLSGGLDSTLVLALAKALHPDPVAYTAVYDTASEDLQHARWVAAELDVPLVEVKVGDVTPQALSAAVRTVEAPMKAQVEIAAAHLPLARAMAGDGFRVALSGEGADELFGGYGNTAIKASKADDAAYRIIKTDLLAKMARGNFPRVNKVFMAAGVEGRLPFLHRPLVELAVDARKAQSPPGKGLLKRAARGLVPDRIITRRKETFQGGTGVTAAAAAAVASPVVFYNAEARRHLGWLPRA